MESLAGNRRRAKFELIDGPTWTPPQSGGSFGVRDLLAIVRRRKLFIATFVIIATLLISIAVISKQETYWAAAKLVLQPTTLALTDNAQRPQAAPLDPTAITTEIEIIRSRNFVGQVVDAMGLVENPWFNPSLPGAEQEWPTVLLQQVKAFVKGQFGSGQSAPPDTETQREATISRLISHLDVTRNNLSRAITVAVDTPEPALSAEIANETVQRYVDWSGEVRRQAVNETVDALRIRADQLAGQIQDTEQAIANLMRENDLAPSRGEDALGQRLDDLNSQLTSARVQLADTQSRRKQGLSVIEGKETIEGTTLSSPLLTSLRSEKAELVRQRAQYAQDFGSNHPQVRELDAQISSTDSMITSEIRRVLSDLSAEEQVAQEKVSHLESQIVELKATKNARGEAEIKLRQLQRSLTSIENVHDVLTQRLGGLDQLNEMAPPRAVVVSTAVPPSASPLAIKVKTIAAGGAGAVILAVIIALALEAVDTRLKTEQRLQQVTRVSNLANVPPFRGRPPKSLEDHLEQLAHLPASVHTQALLSLYLACKAQIAGTRRTIAIAGTLPRDRSEQIAAGLAHAAARDGMRAVILDLDPLAFGSNDISRVDGSRLAQLLETPKGLMDATLQVRGNAGIRALHLASPETGASLRAPIQTMQMHALLEKLHEFNDFVVVNCGPVLITEDANWLAPLVDAVLLVVQFGQAKEQEVSAAMSRLRFNRTGLVCTVLNGVEPRLSGTTEPLGPISFPRQLRRQFTA